ncbi:hypothetical protein MY11210_001386 [Beauveria gryllotalpidicola]
MATNGLFAMAWLTGSGNPADWTTDGLLQCYGSGAFF